MDMKPGVNNSLPGNTKVEVPSSSLTNSQGKTRGQRWVTVPESSDIPSSSSDIPSSSSDIPSISGDSSSSSDDEAKPISRSLDKRKSVSRPLDKAKPVSSPNDKTKTVSSSDYEAKSNSSPNDKGKPVSSSGDEAKLISPPLDKRGYVSGHIWEQGKLLITEDEIGSNLASNLWNLILLGDLAKLKNFLRRNPEYASYNFNEHSKEREHPLVLAALSRNINMVKFVIQLGANPKGLTESEKKKLKSLIPPIPTDIAKTLRFELSSRLMSDSKALKVRVELKTRPLAEREAAKEECEKVVPALYKALNSRGKVEVSKHLELLKGSPKKLKAVLDYALSNRDFKLTKSVLEKLGSHYYKKTFDYALDNDEVSLLSELVASRNSFALSENDQIYVLIGIIDLHDPKELDNFFAQSVNDESNTEDTQRSHQDVMDFALLQCVRKGSVSLVHHLLNANTMSFSAQGAEDALYEAITGCQRGIISMLLDPQNGLSLNLSCDKLIENALISAAKSYSFEMFKILENRGADLKHAMPAFTYLMEKCIDNKNPTAVEDPRYEGLLGKLLDLLRSKKIINRSHYHGFFQFAFKKKSVSMIRWLLRNECPINSFPTLLMDVVRKDCVEMLELILYYPIEDNNFLQMLESAAANNSTTNMKCLITSKRSKNVNYSIPQRVLVAAIKKQSVQAVELLLDKGCKVDSLERYNKGDYVLPMIAAAESNNYSIIKAMDERSQSEKLPQVLFTALKNGDLETIIYLLDSGYNPNCPHIENGIRQYPLDLVANNAQANKALNILMLLLIYGASPEKAKHALRNAASSRCTKAIILLREFGARHEGITDILKEAIQNGRYFIVSALLHQCESSGLKTSAYQFASGDSIKNREKILDVLNDPAGSQYSFIKSDQYTSALKLAAKCKSYKTQLEKIAKQERMEDGNKEELLKNKQKINITLQSWLGGIMTDAQWSMQKKRALVQPMNSSKKPTSVLKLRPMQ